jgi:hypothetical protein
VGRQAGYDPESTWNLFDQSLAGLESPELQIVSFEHASVQTTERYIGCKQKLKEAGNDRFVLSVVDDPA